jgi:hypothetical protein
MKLEKQVCNRELSLKLVNLGAPYESAFEWRCEYDERNQLKEESWYLGYAPEREKTYAYLPAFSVAELGEMLPQGALSFLRSGDALPPWQCLPPRALYDRVAPLNGDTEADARASMLIYLIENKLIS